MSEVDEIAVESPGKQLRMARETKGMTSQAVAKALRLKESIIEALEIDDYDGLPNPVYVQGYLRGYAQLVGVDFEPILSAYKSLQPESPEADSTGLSPVQINDEISSKHGGMRAFTFGLILLGLLFFLLWWKGYLQNGIEQIIGTASKQQEDVAMNGIPIAPEWRPPPSDAEVISMAAVGSMMSSSSRAEEVADEGVITQKEQTDDEQPAKQKEAPIALPAQEQMAETAPVIQSSEVGEPKSEEQPTEPAQEPVVSQESEQTPQPATGLLKVIFESDGLSWVRVEDRSRRVLLHGHINDGTKRDIIGEWPLHVVVGNKSAVRVIVNGKPFDMTPHARGNVARFTLTPDAGGT